jgi:hypothetical protein
MEKKTIDQVIKDEMLQELNDRFHTSVELENYLKRSSACCGICCKRNCMKIDCDCNDNECCKLCPCAK